MGIHKDAIKKYFDRNKDNRNYEFNNFLILDKTKYHSPTQIFLLKNKPAFNQ